MVDGCASGLWVAAANASDMHGTSSLVTYYRIRIALAWV